MKKKKKKNNEKKYSLPKRIVGLTIFLDSVFIVFIVVVGLLIFSLNIQNLREDNALSETNSIVDSIDNAFNEMEIVTYILSESKDIIDYVEYINNGNSPDVNEEDDVFLSYSRALSLMQSLSYIDTYDKHYQKVFVATNETCLFDVNGCMITETGDFYNTSNGFNLIDSPWYNTLQTQNEVLTYPYIEETSNQEIISFVKVLKNADDIEIGYVGVTMLISDISSLLNDIIGEENQLILLSEVNSDQSLLYFSDVNMTEYLYNDVSDFGSIDDRLGYGEQGLVDIISSESQETISKNSLGESYFIFYRMLDHFQIKVIVLIDNNQSISYELILILVLASVLIFIMIIGWITNRTIKQSFSSINHIIYSIDEIKNGNYSVKVNVKENNEIKDIGDAINIMSDEIERQIQLVYDSFAYDQLTGLKNKSAIVNEVNRNLLTGDKKVAVCLIQVDNLKDIIIIKGQMMGDSLIRAISKEISSLISKDEMLYSNGGNELIYIIPNFNNLSEVRDKVSRIVNRFKKPIEVNHIKSEIKIYAGIATYPTDDHNLHDLIKKCDVSIYKDKLEERKQVIFYNNKISQEIAYQAEVSEQLSQALEKKEIYLKYQPLIDNQSEIYGFEALARWASPVLGSISPEVFISNAEENYLIIPIGTWILEEACKMQVALRKLYDREFVISVNVSLIQILQSDYVKVVKSIIKKTDINPNYLTLELTESIFIKSTVALDGKIEELHKLGVKFSLDDFGTGYASLSYLRNIAFDNLKIDKSFIDGILDTNKENKIVATIIQLVHNLDMKVIAEGVEYKSQYEYLKQISTDVFQGYLMSKPLDINEAVSFVNQFYKVAKNRRIDVLAMQKDER
jgi:diguanylate cyclase (GGDEF)-like protein